MNYPKGNKSLIQGLIEEAASAMGIAVQNVRWVMVKGTEWVDKGPISYFAAGTGSVGNNVVGGVGLHRLTTGGVLGGSERGLVGNVVGGWTVTTQPCFVKSRFARSGTLLAGSEQHVGFQSSPFNHGVGIGVFQTVSAANFSVVKCASDVYTGVDTGIEIDTAQHEHMLYRNTAGAWFWRVDNGALTSMTTTGQPTSGNEAYGHVMVNNAAAAATLLMDLDYCFWAGREAA